MIHAKVHAIDPAGKKATSGYYFPDGSTSSTAAALIAAIKGVCDAELYDLTMTSENQADVGAIVDAAHNSVEDKLIIVGTGDLGEKMKISMPAPKPALFTGGSIHCDIVSAGAAKTLADAVSAAWKTTNGGAVTVTEMYRSKVKRQKTR